MIPTKRAGEHVATPLFRILKSDPRILRRKRWLKTIAGRYFPAHIETTSHGIEPQRIAFMATEIRVPKIGASVTKASIGRWFKRVGDPVSLNEPLVEIETDGTTIEVPALATGVLSDILLRDGESVKAGTLLGTITEYRSDTKTPGQR
jgi:Pyruvate/2-oxoglutarate dehydrogenase complex, dihydrolipoamide acyltransferase (E2) component, and related enzymes